MMQITPFMRWLDAQVEAVGWTEVMRRAGPAFTGGALQGWLRGSIPGPGNQAVLAQIFNVPPQTITDLVWEAWAIKDGVVAARPPQGGRRRASLSPKRRRRLAAFVLALPTLWGSLAGAAPPVDAERPSLPLIGRPRRRYFGEVSPALA